eukprot:NODE_17000_length_966_cov_4.069130.p3 GENE.NODE_17000_length_966_cov_4.069130~~NODE_17000_length_966_cov_4.069130.p3  ORF type:complete len:131 (+),score=22.28 NODE_17000_length_966_cov_4.069130:243-635(+)
MILFFDFFRSLPAAASGTNSASAEVEARCCTLNSSEASELVTGTAKPRPKGVLAGPVACEVPPADVSLPLPALSPVPAMPLAPAPAPAPTLLPIFVPLLSRRMREGESPRSSGSTSAAASPNSARGSPRT